MTSRATVTCGCGASAVFEDWLPSTTDTLVGTFNKAHESCRIARRDYRPASPFDKTCDRLYGPCRCGKTHVETDDRGVER